MRTYDVAIIGGGIIGCSIAFELSSHGFRVIVVDRQEPALEASWAAAGMLSPAPDSPRDAPLVPFARESLRLYPQFVQAIEEKSGKSTAYTRHGALEVFLSAGAERRCADRLRELSQVGIPAEPLLCDAARKLEPAIGASTGAALRIPGEATVEPRVLMDALATAVRNSGAEIRSNCAATGIIRDGPRCAGVLAGGETISAGHVVLAAGCFSGQITNEPWLARIAPVRPVRGQMLALRPAADGRLRQVVRSDSGYLVPRSDGRIVAGSTLEEAGFEKRVTAAGLRKILDASLETCPALASAEVVETWSGLRPGTPDDLPVLGSTSAIGLEGLWIATGHYRNGILLAAATAKLFREWITGAEPSFDARRFSPARFALPEAGAKSAD
ncbi:MAG: glycine oxidase ThiO [Acidobacteriota bacterium]|nr:glycine oxidase ThiO [Acidobacteriota bacterium]